MSSHEPNVLGHGDDYDGIEEYDNKLPAWWLGILWFTVIWGVIYGVHYHFVADRSQVGEYRAEMDAAAAQWPQGDPSAIAFADVDGGAGKAIYEQNCVACHGATMEGGIGPSFKDTAWIHGGSFEQIVATVSTGVAAKGMPAWLGVLGAERVAQVAKYVYENGGKDDGSGAAQAAAAPADAAPASAGSPGEALFNGAGACMACHSVDGSPRVGPSLKDKVGAMETLTDGSQVLVDKAYFIESVKDPNAKVVKDFAPTMTPRPDLTDEQLGQLFDYLSSISAHASAAVAADGG